MIPIGTSNRLNHRPTANIILIALNFIIFLIPFFLRLTGNPEAAFRLHELLASYQLHSEYPRLYEFITYAFLHANFSHIAGNMIFLLIFGNNVNDRLGNTGYLLLYLGGAIFSGIGHVVVSQANVLGASGAVAAITGAYMVLFPKTYINVLWMFILITTFEIPAVYFILFKLIILDNILAPRLYGAGNVAYTAHLAGYFFGIAIPMFLLSIKLLPHSQYDLWAVFQRWHRRQRYQATVSDGYNPYGVDKPQSDRRKVFAKVRKSAPAHPHAEEITTLRNQVNQAMGQGDLDTAAKSYRSILELDAEHVMPQQYQLDLANKLMQDNQHPQAAQAYELFLENYRQYPFIEQIQLMLGLLYSRYLNKPQTARKNLQAALEKLQDSGQRQMCQDELKRLQA